MGLPFEWSKARGVSTLHTLVGRTWTGAKAMPSHHPVAHRGSIPADGRGSSGEPQRYQATSGRWRCIICPSCKEGSQRATRMSVDQRLWSHREHYLYLLLSDGGSRASGQFRLNWASYLQHSSLSAGFPSAASSSRCSGGAS